MPGHRWLNGWLSGALAATALATTAYSIGRAVAGPLLGRCVNYDVDITRALMGASMAGMFVANLSFLSAAIWRTAFAVSIAWFAIRAIARAQNPSGPRQGLLDQTGHLLSVAAMLYMLHTMPSAPPRAIGSTSTPLGMPMNMAMPATHVEASSPALALLLAALLLGHAFSLVSRVRSIEAAPTAVRTNAPGTTGLPPLAPRADAISEAVKCAAMAVMLVATH